MSYPISVNVAVLVATIIPTWLLFWCRAQKFPGKNVAFLFLSCVSCIPLAVACRGVGFFSPTLVMVAFFVTIGLFIISLTVDAHAVERSYSRPIILSASGIFGLMFAIWFDSHFLCLNSLLRKHPMVSLEERLEYESEFRVPTNVRQAKVPFTGKLRLKSADKLEISNAEGVDLNHLNAFERDFEDDSDRRENRQLNRSLVALLAAHHGIEQQFRMSAGFGRERTFLMPYRRWRLDFPEAPLLPTQRPTIPATPEYLATVISTPEVVLAPWHRKNLISFTSSPSLGVVGWGEKQSDLSKTVGFKEHAVQRYPDTAIQTENGVQSWRIESMLLISLLRHRPPAVYVSENLPNMKELLSVPTRQPNNFESDALKRLTSGEDLVVQCETSQIQMVGAIRAAFQCLECHQVPRGTLLGAFTYDLSPISRGEAEGLEPITLSAQSGD